MSAEPLDAVTGIVAKTKTTRKKTVDIIYIATSGYHIRQYVSSHNSIKTANTQ